MAPCIQFGAPGLTLNLAGFTITGQGDSSTGCLGSQVGTVAGTANEDGIFAVGQSDITVKGPGLVQRFRAAGIDLRNGDRSLVVHVAASTNCNSGILVGDSVDDHRRP